MRARLSLSGDTTDGRHRSREPRFVVGVTRHVPRVRIPAERIRRTLQAVGRGERGHGEVSVIIVDDTMMRQLNSRYRKTRQPTDVLAFPLENSDHTKTGDVPFLGEIYCNYDHARRWRDENGGTISEELIRLAVHGCLHLFGYDHHSDAGSMRMAAAEDRYMSQQGLLRVRNGNGARDAH